MEEGGAEKAGAGRVGAPAALARGLLVGPQRAASAPRAFPSGVPAATPTPAPRTILPGNSSAMGAAKKEKPNNSSTTSAPRTPVPSKNGGTTPAASSPAPDGTPRSHEASPRHQNHQRKPRRPSGDRDQGGKGQRRNGDELPKQHSDKDDPSKIIVTGYPPYSQPQDLTRVFAKYGNVKLEKISHRYAIIVYTSPDDAKLAVEASKKVNVYGEFMKVEPYSDARLSELSKRVPKRDFTMSKQKGIIIDPKQIDLSGDFHQQLERILAGVRLTQEDVAALTVLYTDLETAMQQQWPGCTAIPFGSITTGLGVKSSDADCYMHVPHASAHAHAHANYINKAKRVLLTRPDLFAEILSIPRANTPIVKLFHIPTQTNCDLTFKTPLGAQNSKLVAFLLHADPRLIPMAVVIKYWAKVHEFSGTGKLSNYALTLLIIFYLQQPPMSILPSVEWLQQDAKNDVIVDSWNTGFMSRRECLPKSSNTSSISELLGGFFEYYSMFNFDEMAVCPYLGTPVRKDVFHDLSQLPAPLQRYRTNVLEQLVYPLRSNTPMVVQDPFEQSHNVASAINGRLAAEIRAYFKFAANAYEKEKLASCQHLLETILLQKPKIIRAKCHPEYRVNLFPRIIVTIIDPDWKPIVRDLVFVIFEKMLKIKLGKVEEKVNMDTKKEKEKYMGNVTRAIWKRKQFSRLYSVMDLGFLEKQARITDEILKVDKQVVAVQFQLTLTFCHAPRSAVVAIKLGAGDLTAFRDFGKFFISVMQGWFMNLLRPYARPPEQDTAAKIADTIHMLDAGLHEPLDSDDDSLSLLNNSTAFADGRGAEAAVY